MRGQKYLRSMKTGVNWIENQGENWYNFFFKLLNNTFWWNIRPNLGSRISRTKCDKDKPICSAEREGQSDRDEA